MYNKVNWADYPNTDTPLMADLLNHMDEQIEENTADLDGLKAGTLIAKIASKLGKDTVGSSSSPIYISNGTPVECTQADEVKDESGIVSNKAVYKAFKEGMAEKIGVKDVGTEKTPMYLKKGVPTASEATVGNKTTPIYMKNGVFTACEKEALQTVTAKTETVTGKITLPNTEIKTTAICTSDTVYDKTKSYITGITALQFSNTFHEWHCSDYEASFTDEGKVQVKVTVPTRAEIRGKSSDITVKVTVITL